MIMRMINTLFIFVTLAILAGAMARLLQRYVLKETDPYAYSFLTQIISAVFFLPFALANFTLPTDPKAWVVLAGASILWTLVSLTASISYKGTEVSLRDPIAQSKLLWVLPLSILFLKEQITVYRALGTLIIFLGVSLLIWHPERKLGRLADKGVRWTLMAALLAAVVTIVDKAALRWFVPEVYGFMVYFFPMMILVLFLQRRKHHVNHLFKNRAKSALLAIMCSVLTYYFTLKAFAVADVTLAYPLLQLTTVITVFGGIIMLKEREHIWQKMIAAVLVVIGASILHL